MLTIGDLALTKIPQPEFPFRYDLGELWHEFTGLPCVFALWHVNYKKNIERDLDMLYDILVASKAYGISHLGDLTRSEAERFKLPPEFLFSYWNSLSYGLGREEQKGLRAFYGYAAEIGVIETIPELRFWTKG
jgi:chorismate dehydratase